MNRKAAGIILSIASVALLVGIFCRPSVQPMTPERHEWRTPASPSTTELSHFQEAADELQALSAGSAQGLSANGSEPTAPELQVALPSEPLDPRFHPGERVPAAKIAARYGDEPLTADHPDMAAAIRIQERHPELLANPAVVGTAVGLNDDGQISLIVYTKVDAPEIPRTIEGLPVAVWRSGEILARRQDATARRNGNGGGGPGGGGGGDDGGPTPPPTFDPTLRHRPAPIGVSTGHPLITAGTLGCRMTDGTNVFALSNNHVYANSGDAVIGDNALQPGDFDGGQNPGDAFGTLHDFKPILFSSTTSSFPGNNTIDAALVKITTAGDLLNNTHPDAQSYGTPRTTTVSAGVGMKVQKYGRTTMHTAGRVKAINATFIINYTDAGGPTRYARFVGQITVSPGGFSAGGDSGSLIVGLGGSSDRKPVGLLFAGSSSITIANPIGIVLSAFPGVTIDGDPN